MVTSPPSRGSNGRHATTKGSSAVYGALELDQLHPRTTAPSPLRPQAPHDRNFFTDPPTPPPHTSAAQSASPNGRNTAQEEAEGPSSRSNRESRMYTSDLPGDAPNRGSSGREEGWWHGLPIKPLLVGQLLSFLVAGTGVCTTLMDKYTELIAPITQNVPMYFFLSFMLLHRNARMWDDDSDSRVPPDGVERDSAVSASKALIDEPTAAPSGRTLGERIKAKVTPGAWWPYFVLAAVDVQANVLVVWAYQYTSITSAMLIDCFTIPSAMVLSRIFLHARFTYTHIGGALLCMCGLSCIVLSDALADTQQSDDDDNDDDDKYPHAVLGDMMCFLGAFLYAVSNVLEEYLVSHVRPQFVLGRLGVCGLIIGCVEASALEHRVIFRPSVWTWPAISILASFTLINGAAYVTLGWFFIHSDSTMFNLSILTSDIYAVIFSYFLTGQLVHWLYFIAFGLTMSGLVIYHRGPVAVPKAERSLSYAGLPPTTTLDADATASPLFASTTGNRDSGAHGGGFLTP